MKLCISFGKFELKYFFYCALLVIIYLYIYFFMYYIGGNILYYNLLFHSSCFFLGYLLNIIPTLISYIKSKEKGKENHLSNKFKEENTLSIEYIYNKPYEKYLSSKDILKFFFICLILLLVDLIEDIVYIINTKGNDEDKLNNYDDCFTVIEYIIIFLVSKFDKEVYYKHQYISFFILILVEAVKKIYFLFKAANFNTSFFIKIVLSIIYSILYSIYYIFIKELMKYKFISPSKCNFMIGIINFPLTILIYFIISFTSLGNKNSKYYYDNIFELINNFGKSVAKNIIILISLPFSYGIVEFIFNRIIYDYTIFHIYIPILIDYFVENIIKNFGSFENIFLISSFLIELIMILIFLEIIEINCCGLNENLKSNIESRGIIDSSLIIEDDDYDDGINDEKNNDKTKLYIQIFN